MSAVARRNGRTAAIFALVGLAMLGLAFAAVPLYRLFCQVTGFGGTTQMNVGGSAPGEVVGKIVNVRFDANTNAALPWSFQPEKHVDRAAIGARKMAFYTARNNGTLPVTGTATFNVTPVQAGQYFSKIQCFCFTEQTLQPGQQVRMPVLFYIDKRFLDDPDAADVEEVTLSYTFYPVEKPDDES